MTFEELETFLRKQMRMSHIYQPLLIRSLLDAGGSATVRQLATAFLIQDESQLRYYEKRIKAMPVRVLKSHGVVERDGELISLTAGKLTLEQIAGLRMLCEQRMQEYVQKRGLSLWDYRLLEADPIPDSVRYMVLKESGGRCALCGATKQERPLDVDHIKPRSKGGTNDPSNLQVLCSKCNRSKGNKDDTDFRDAPLLERDPDCPFCSEEMRARTVEENDSVFAIEDNFPVTPGHVLIIPKRHASDFFAMTSQERRDAEGLLRILKERIARDDPSVTGFNVGVNCGESAGQTIMHAHIHLIPRRDGDLEDPRGGVRGVIPEKQSY